MSIQFSLILFGLVFAIPAGLWLGTFLANLQIRVIERACRDRNETQTTPLSLPVRQRSR